MPARVFVINYQRTFLFNIIRTGPSVSGSLLHFSVAVGLTWWRVLSSVPVLLLY